MVEFVVDGPKFSCLTNVPRSIDKSRPTSSSKQSNTPRHPTAPTGTGQQYSGPSTANIPSITLASPSQIPTGTPSRNLLDSPTQRKGAFIAGADVQNIPINLPAQIATMPSSKSSSCSGDSGLSMSWSPRSPASSDIRIQRHQDKMRGFLESASIRRLDEPLTGGNSHPRGEAQAVKDCASPLPNIISFSPALNDNAWFPNMDMDSSSTIADESATQGFSDILTDLQKSYDLLEPGVSDFFVPFPGGQDRKYSIDHSDISLSPTIGRDLTMAFSDSGFCDRSPETLGHCRSFQESPFMGHDSPETMFEMWPRFGKSVDTQSASVGPGILNHAGAELQPAGFGDIILFPPSSDPFPTTPGETLPGFAPLMGMPQPPAEPATARRLSPSGFTAIVEYVLRPMMMDETLSEFREILRNAEEMMKIGKITSLRDLEKVLLLELGHQPSTCTASSYLSLCREFFERSMQLWAFRILSDDDICLPSEQPYDQNYVRDAWHTVIGKTQMRFEIRPEELDPIVRNMRQTSATCDVSNARVPSKGCVQRTSDAAMSPLKRRNPGPTEVGPARKRPRPAADTCSMSLTAESQEMASAAASAAAFNQTPAGGSASFTSPPTNPTQHTRSSNQTYVASQPRTTSTFIFDSATLTATSQVQHRQTQQHRTPVITRSVPTMGQATRIGIAPPSPNSIATLSPSDASGHHRKRNTTRATEQAISFPCDKCDKNFPRQCDLKKHVKTHERPHKCPVKACHYATFGFSAEKDRDRHFADKHDTSTPKKECDWKCGYSSPRESNVKQHMEKAHGYNYVRTKCVQKGSKKHRISSGKEGARSSPPPAPRPRKARRISVPAAPAHQPEPQSANTTPMMSNSGYHSDDSSFQYGFDTLSPDTHTLSPETLLGEPSPACPTRKYTPPFTSPPRRRSPPSQGIAPEHLYGQNEINNFQTTENAPRFPDPSAAVQAMNSDYRQQSESHYNHYESCSFLNPNAKADAALAGDSSPDSVREFADSFLRDAPPHLWEAPQLTYDPRLPIVPNNIYNPSKDLDYK